MAVFIKNPADHWREEHAVGERPVRNSETGFCARYHSSCENQEGCAQSREHREPVEPYVPLFRSRHSYSHLISCVGRERKVQLRSFSVGYCDCRDLFAVAFMPRNDFVSSGRQVQTVATRFS